MVREARRDELERLREIELAAGEVFRTIGMAEIADDELPSIPELEAFQRDGRAWVVADEEDRAVAYVLVEVVDGRAHVEQVSVHPDHARRGLGRELLAMVATWADARGLRGLSLTTFRDVPWNAPYYERLGFRIVEDAVLTPGLRRISEAEAARGLARWPRVAMLIHTSSLHPSRPRVP